MKTLNYGYKKSLLSALCIACISQNLYAEDDDVGLISLEDLLNIEVTTASKSAQKISDAPATIYAFSRTQIKNRGYRNLEQLLEDVPEIEIQRKAVAEYNNYYSFRGIAGNDKLVILLDGYRVNSPTGSPHVIATNYSLVDAERVEVILGPASALYGADALSGIINIITRNPDAETYTNLYASSGSFSTREYSINSRYKNDDLSLMFTAQFYESDEDNLAKAYPDEFSWYNNEYLNQGIVQLGPFAPPFVTLPVPEVNYDRTYSTPTESHFIHLTANYDKFDFGFSDILESHSSSGGMKPEFNLYIDKATYKTQIQNVFAEHSHQTKDEKISLKTAISHSTYELKPESVFYNTFTQYSAGYKYGKGSTTKFEEQLTYVMDDDNQFISGLSYESISALPKTGDLPFPFDPNVPAELQNIHYIGTDVTDINGNDLTLYQSFFDIKYENVAFYFQWQHVFSETLSLTSGVRYDDNTRYGSTVNPRVGLVWKASDTLTVKGLFNSGFLAPSPYVSYQHYGAFNAVDDNFDFGDITQLVGFFWHLPNPSLQPEELESKEINVTWNLSSSMRLSFDYYQNTLDQQIVPVIFEEPTSINGIEIFDGSFRDVLVFRAEIPINNATTETDGYTLKLDHLTNINDFQVTSFIAYSASDGDINGNQALTYMAEDTIKFGIEISKDNWSMYLNALNRSDTRRQFDPRYDGTNDDFFISDGFTTFNLFTQYTQVLNDSSEVEYQLKITNLTDKKYFNATFGADEAFIGSPQNTRKVEFAVNFHF